MIEVQGLTKSYGAVAAVRDLSFSVAPGEVLGLVGPNGAGKTTTLRSIVGIVRPTGGAIRVGGHDVEREPVAAKRLLAFMPDEPHLFDYLTVEEHLRFTARLHAVADVERRIPPLLQELELSEKAQALPGELSRGMKQKLVIACGLLHDPRALLFDEPLTGLDPAGIRRMKQTIKERARQGFVVGGLYLYWLVLRPRRGTGLGGVASPNGDIVAVGLLGALVLFNWLFGSAESPFTFNLAETQYLFTAPLTRRQVIDFKLLRSQVPLFISAAASALIFSGGHVSGLSLIRVVGLWLVYGTLQLHYAGMSLLRASLAQQGVTGLRRRLGSLLVLASLLALAWWSVRRALPGVVAAFGEDPQRGYAALASIMHTGPLGVLVWPLEAVVAPLLAPSAAAFAGRGPAAVAVLGAHYIWVVRSTLAFEEAAEEHAAKLARRIEAVREGRWAAPTSRAPKSTGGIRLRLAPTGGPGVAILWKNAVGATRDLSQRTFVLIAVVVIGGSMALASGPMRWLDLVAVLLLGTGGLTLLFCPLAGGGDRRHGPERAGLAT